MTDTRPLKDLETRLQEKPKFILKNGIAKVWEKPMAGGGFSKMLLGSFDNIYGLAAEWIIQGEADPRLLNLDIPYTPRPENDPKWLPTPIDDPVQCQKVYHAANESWNLYNVARSGNAGEAVKQYCEFASKEIGIDILKNPLIAVKVLVPPKARNADDQKAVSDLTLRKFIDEYSMLRRLREHPNIVRTYGLLHEPQLGWCLLMDYIEGTTLQNHLETIPGNKLPVPTAFKLMERIADAVQYCHQNGIVHRDIKPANILLREDGVDAQGNPKFIPYLCDFGISKNVDTDLTQTVATMFTPNCASPEQIRGEATTTASDVYQLASMLFQMVTGHMSYEDMEIGAMVKLIGNIEEPHPTAVRDYLPNISERAKDAIEIGRRKDPEKRFILPKFITDISYVIQNEQWEQAPGAKPTRTQLIETKKILDFRMSELDTKIEFIKYDEEIDLAERAFDKGENTVYESKVNQLTTELNSRPKRFAPLREEYCKMLLNIAEQRQQLGQYTDVSFALGNVSKVLEKLPAKEYVELYARHKSLSDKFSPFAIWVKMHGNVLDELKSARTLFEEVYKLDAKDEKPADQVTTLARKLQDARQVWSAVKAENIGSNAYERVERNLREMEVTLEDFKRKHLA